MLIFIIVHYALTGWFQYNDPNAWNTPDYHDHHSIKTLDEVPDVCSLYHDEKCAENWLSTINKIQSINMNKLMNVDFRSAINNSVENSNSLKEIEYQYEIFHSTVVQKAKKFQFKNFSNPETRRIFKFLTGSIETSNKTLSKQLIEINMNISYTYNKARPCFQRCLVPGENGIRKLFANERNYDVLLGFWDSWRDVTGKRIKNLFIERMKLLNIKARENNYKNSANYDLIKDFEDENFERVILSLYNEILPLYKELHGYVRFCLMKYYPNRFNGSGPIPAHILGNVWGQQWSNIFDIIQACRNKTVSRSFKEEVKKNLNNFKSEREIFVMAENFFESIGLYKMTKQFWERSVFRSRNDVIMDCHGSAHNFMNKQDFRIKMCTEKAMGDFVTAHHEMGHIQYYMAYKNLHYVLQNSANAGFHEAIGDLIALSVQTPEHMYKVGLISSLPKSDEFDIDYLLDISLDKVVFLPFALVMDSFVWSIYNESVPPSMFNEFWWNLRYKYQGLKPPIPRSKEHFDPGSKYHVAFDVSYIRYFISHLLQFQFYETLCNISGYKGPLHRCDFYQSKKAGKKLLEMLQWGRSKPWPTILKLFTGTSEVSAKPMLKFFEPLHKWLVQENRKYSIPVGW